MEDLCGRCKKSKSKTHKTAAHRRLPLSKKQTEATAVILFAEDRIAVFFQRYEGPLQEAFGPRPSISNADAQQQQQAAAGLLGASYMRHLRNPIRLPDNSYHAEAEDWDAAQRFLGEYQLQSCATYLVTNQRKLQEGAIINRTYGCMYAGKPKW